MFNVVIMAGLVATVALLAQTSVLRYAEPAGRWIGGRDCVARQ
jgi:hypothetical protein